MQWRRIFPPRNVAEHRLNRQWLFVPDWLRTMFNPLRESVDSAYQLGR